MTKEKKAVPAAEEELTVYEKLRQQVSRSFRELNEKLNPESVGRVMDKAMVELKEAGEHSKEAIAGAGAALQKDIASSLRQLKPKVEEDLEETREHFNRLQNKGGALWREIANEAEHLKEVSLDKGGAFLFNVSRGLGEWAGSLSDKIGSSLTYKTGEVTHGGTFSCAACGAELNLKKPGRIPPCPKCTKTEFRRA